jgi:type VI protein secretion system component VasK
MIRGYAIGLGAGTQVLTHLPWFLVFGAPGEVATALLMAAGWVINVAVAEWVVRRRPAVRRTRIGA